MKKKIKLAVIAPIAKNNLFSKFVEIEPIKITVSK